MESSPFLFFFICNVIKNKILHQGLKKYSLNGVFHCFGVHTVKCKAGYFILRMVSNMTLHTAAAL